MHATQSTHATPTTAPPRRRLLVLVDGPFPGHQHERAALIAARARAADVLVVAPAVALSDERWIIDLDARRARARANLGTWIEALADEAAGVRGEIGDESPSLAVADALDGFAADEYLDVRLPAGASPSRRRPLESLQELLPAAPAARGLPAGHA